MNSPFVVVVVLLAGTGMLLVLFATRWIGYWRSVVSRPIHYKPTLADVLFSVLCLLSVAAIVFSLHALLAAHGAYGGSR